MSYRESANARIDTLLTAVCHLQAPNMPRYTDGISPLPWFLIHVGMELLAQLDRLLTSAPLSHDEDIDYLPCKSSTVQPNHVKNVHP